ncbi:MAG: helix-turn-helix domain-containing protein [Bdellovibrionota bacterium]|nr:helix-turn-helix domain-containing protein [Bdellovibrionota bacterium]
MKKSEKTRLRILEATQELIKEKGFESASVREIAKRASVNVASINYYFSKKENLMGEILILLSEELFNSLKENIESHGDQLNIESLGLKIYDVLKENEGLHSNFKKMLFDSGIMSTKRVKEKAENGSLTPGHTFILDFLKEKESNIEYERISLHLWGLIDQALYLAHGAYGEVNGPLGHGHIYVRDSLLKSIQDFEKSFAKDPH